MSKMSRRNSSKKTTQELLASLWGRQTDNIDATVQHLQQGFNGDQLDDCENESRITPVVTGNNLNSSSSSNVSNTQEKEEPLVVKVKDILTREITTQKMQPDRVWNLEKNKNIMVELNGDGQESDNGSNLLVRFLGILSQKLIFCPIVMPRECTFGVVGTWRLLIASERTTWPHRLIVINNGRNNSNRYNIINENSLTVSKERGLKFYNTF